MKSYFQLIRWKNLLMLLLTLLLMNYCVAVPLMSNLIGESALKSWQLILLLIGVVLEAAGGYAVNDYFDVKIDAINRPKTRVVGRLLDRNAAIQTYLTCSIVGAICGLALAILLRSWSLGVLFIFMPGLMWFYSSAYKRQMLIGNLIVALAIGVSVLMVALAQSAAMHHQYGDLFEYYESPLYKVETTVYLFSSCFAGFAALLTFIREIIKDCEDEEGDREMECRTLPIRLGTRGTKVILYIMVLLTAVLVYFFGQQIPAAEGAVNLTQQYLLFLVIIPLCVLLYVIYSAQCKPQWHQASTFVKAVMGAGILYSIVFCIQLHG